MIKKLFIAASLAIASALGAHATAPNVTTWMCDLTHSGVNPNETLLTPTNVASTGTFGFLFSQPLDGQSFGQVLYASNISAQGGTHNIIYIATEHDSLYAYDADTNIPVLWHDSFIPTNAEPCPQSIVGSGDISVELGITTTPVINLATNTIYIVSKVLTTAARTDGTGSYAANTVQQYLHAINMSTGAEEANSPVIINPTFAGSSNWYYNPQNDQNDGYTPEIGTYEQSGTTSPTTTGIIPFSALHEHTRAAMTFDSSTNTVYITYASHSDMNAYHGLILGYDGTTLQIKRTFIDTPNATNAGIQADGGFWSGGAGPAFDGNGNMFVMSANGIWDQNTSPYTTETDWSESILRLSTTGTGPFGPNFADKTTFFTPNNYNNLTGGDLDLGGGGLCLLPPQTGGSHTHIMVGGGKGAVLYVVDRDNPGGENATDTAIQEIPEQGGDKIFCTPAYFFPSGAPNGYIYYAPNGGTNGGQLEQRAVGYNAATLGYIADPPTYMSSDFYGAKGSGCFITANGTTNGVVWTVTGGNLRAYNAANVSGNAIYSYQLPPGYGVTKFQLPTVAGGKAYVTAFNPGDNNASNVYVLGLQQNYPTPPSPPPGNLTATAASSSEIDLSWTNTATDFVGFTVERSASAAGPFVPIGNTGSNVLTYQDTNLTPETTYYYEVVSYNNKGDSAPASVVPQTTLTLFTSPGLVAYWPFDEDTGQTANDITGNGHTGTLDGEINWTAGEINSALQFHGTGHAQSSVVVPNSPALQFTASQSFTISAWVNPQNLTGVEQAIIAKSADQGNEYGIFINANTQWVFRGPSGDLVGPTVVADTWTHVVGVQNGAAGTRTLYVNGVAYTGGTAQDGSGAGDLWIAQQNLLLTQPDSFPGYVDEVKVYNIALTASQIPDIMGPPVLQAISNQVHGTAGTFGLQLSPAPSVVTEIRKGSTAGSYSLVLTFSAPVPNISVALQLQGGGTGSGTVGTLGFSNNNSVVTVPLTNVADAQALNLHLTGILPGTPAVADVPFNVLWGDVNENNYVDYLDALLSTQAQGENVTSSTYLYDVDCNGLINAADTTIVTNESGTSVGTQADTNLAIFQPATDSTSLSSASQAVDNNVSTRWESIHGVDPQWFEVDLGSISTIHSIYINWENAAAASYYLQWSNDDQTWNNIIPEITGFTTGGNANDQYPVNFPGLNQQARYVRMLGETRTGPYGYSIWEFQVNGIPGSHSANPKPSLTGDLTFTGTVATAFPNTTITASNSPTNFSQTGFPTGLTISAAGVISGTPQTGGTITGYITATNGSGSSAVTPVVFTIAGGSGGTPVVSTTPAPPGGTVGTAYAGYQFSASNGPITSYQLAAGSAALPGGLSLSTSGAITGTPNAAGTFPFSVTATNGTGTGAAANFSITISTPGSAPVVNTTPAPPSGTAGTVYAGYQFSASNGPITSYQLAAGSAALPGGLSLSTSGAITGTPNAVGTFPFSVTATNSSGLTSAAASFSITIAAGSGGTPVVSTTPAPLDGTVGAAYSGYQFSATNGPITSYQLAAGSAALPGGLTLSASGAITGTPNAVGTFPFSVTATNSSGLTSSAVSFTINIGAANTSVVTTLTPAAGLQNGYYSYPLAASNNPSGYTTTSGALPAGLTFVNISGGWFVAGTPTGSGQTVVSIAAVNTAGNGPAASETFNIAANSDANLSLGTGVTATSSSPTTDLSAASLAIDGNLGTRWETEHGTAADPSTITINLGASYAIDSIDIDWEDASAQAYTIWASPTGVAGSYNQIESVPNNPGGGGMNLFTGVGTTAQYIQLIGTARNTIYGYSMYEFQIFGHTAGGAVPVVSTTPAPPGGTVGTTYAGYQFSASNGPITSYQLAAGSAALPGGLSLSTSGAITGTPNAAGTFPFSVTATNGTGTGAATNFSITIAAGALPVVSTTPAPPSGTVGVNYAGYQFSASNGPIISYQLAAGSAALPGGLSLSTAGVITGTPNASGTFPFSVTATNTSGTGSAANFSITIAPSGGGSAPVISATPVPLGGAVGAAYAGYQFSASNGPITSYQLAAGSAALPGGLTLSASGAITGTPNAVGTFTFSVTATNSGGLTSQAASFTINIGAANTSVTTTITPTAGLQNGYYSYVLTPSNGATGYTVTSGALPPGLTFVTTSGLWFVEGTPTASGQTTVSVAAVNAAGNGAAAVETFNIAANSDANLSLGTGVTATSSSPTTDISAASLAIDNNFGTRWETEHGTAADPSTITINLGASYAIDSIGLDWEDASAQAYTIWASPTGVAGSYNQIESVPNNPPGGGMNLFTGVNTTAQYIQLIGTARNTIYGYSMYEFQIFGHTVSGALPVVSTTPAPPGGTVGTAYAGYQFSASNGPITSYQLATGSAALPGGLTLSASGAITGTPNAAGTFPFSVTATNGSGTGSAASFSITIAAGAVPVVSTTPAPPNGTVGVNYASYQFSASNGPITSYQLATGSAALPGGLTLSTSGAITGTPNAAGTFPFSVTATNGSGTGSAASFSITIAAGSPPAGTPSIVSAPTAFGTVGTAFNYTLSATNTPITSFQLAAGSAALPSGLTYSSTTGAITGTPLAAGVGTTTVSFTATNGAGTGSAQAVAISIYASGAAPTITSPTSATATVGSAFSYQITGSDSPTTYTLVSGTLPAGLTFLSTGTITGTPSAAGNAPLSLRAANGTGGTTFNLTITVGAATTDTNVGVNLATGNYSASTVQAGNSIQFAADGNANTRWAAASGTVPQYWEVNLGASKTLSRVDINWYNNAGRYNQYTILTSPDGINWTTQVDKTSNITEGLTSDTFATPVTAQYVIVNSSFTSAGFVSAYEIQVYGH